MQASQVAQWCKKNKNKKNPPANAGNKRHGFNSWVREIPWSRKWQPTPVFLTGKFHGQRSLMRYNPWGHKELGTTELLSMHTFV